MIPGQTGPVFCFVSIFMTKVGKSASQSAKMLSHVEGHSQDINVTQIANVSATIYVSGAVPGAWWSTG